MYLPTALISRKCKGILAASSTAQIALIVAFRLRLPVHGVVGLGSRTNRLFEYFC